MVRSVAEHRDDKTRFSTHTSLAGRLHCRLCPVRFGAPLNQGNQVLNLPADLRWEDRFVIPSKATLVETDHNPKAYHEPYRLYLLMEAITDQPLKAVPRDGRRLVFDPAGNTEAENPK